MNAAELRDLVGRCRFTFYTEVQLQDALEDLFKSRGLQVGREVPLDAPGRSGSVLQVTRPRRIDFLIGGVGVEVKIGGGFADLARQVQAYAKDPRVEEILVVTSVASHTRLPDSIQGKRLLVAFLGFGAM